MTGRAGPGAEAAQSDAGLVLDRRAERALQLRGQFLTTDGRLLQ
jgi:hypothetical protein